MGIEDQRHLMLHSPLGMDVLLVRHISGRERLGECFEYLLDLYSDDANLKAEDLLGQHATVRMQFGTQPERMFDGIVCEFAHVGYVGRHHRYRAVLRPWLWLLSRNRDCRVFQNKTTLEIARDVFQRAGFSDLEDRRMYELKKRDYCIQYRESDLVFLTRLFEDDGIYFFFEHELGRHVLVLADSLNAHATVPGYETVHYKRSKIDDPSKVDSSVYSWTSNKQLRAGQFSQRDYDFNKPRATLETQGTDPAGHDNDATEIYDYPGNYLEMDAGQARTKMRMEEVVSSYELSDGTMDATGIFAGALFTLADHPRDAENREYLVTVRRFDADSGSFESGTGGSHHYGAHVRAIDSSVPFRPARLTHAPVIPGAQTATVVGDKSNEIWTDEYGRVKVQFHWDRQGKSNESSSCWVRVAQQWAGSGWGSFHVPRIGQEVVVEFLDGNPDRPLVTGSVYNADNRPPYASKDDHSGTRSGIKTHSTKDGSDDNYNELRFEDKAGAEQLYMQAERNMDTLVKKDQTLSVGANRTKTVTGKETNTIDGGRETTIEKFDNLTVNSANKNTTVHGQFNTTVDEHFKVMHHATQLFLKDKVYIETDGNIELKNGGTQYTGGQSGKLTLSATDQISIQCGVASIVLKKDGTIKITGTTVQIGTQTNNAKYEPPGITVSAAKISQTAIGLHEIAGALVKVG